MLAVGVVNVNKYNDTIDAFLHNRPHNFIYFVNFQNPNNQTYIRRDYTNAVYREKLFL